MQKEISQSILQEFVDQGVTRKNIFSAVICVENSEGSISQVGAGGNMEEETPYFIASVTKLFITAIILKLKTENRLQLDDPIANYLSEDIVSGLHILNGVDYSSQITIKHLLSNTSGIPDYFTFKAFRELLKGQDQSWPLERTLETVKQMKPKFIPGQKGKVHYCDTNFQLLGKIIETITGKPLHNVFKECIFDVLNLNNTYVYIDKEDFRPSPFYYKSKQLHIPQFMSSIQADGGIVSTAREMMLFYKAFWGGKLFPKKEIIEITSDWNLLFMPGLFYYGIGISRQPYSIFSFNKEGLIGHWGQSGAFAFYHPQKDLFFTGTVNQVIGQGAAWGIMKKLIKYLG